MTPLTKLPGSVRLRLKKESYDIWLNAYNHALEQYNVNPAHSRSFKTANEFADYIAWNEIRANYEDCTHCNANLATIEA